MAGKGSATRIPRRRLLAGAGAAAATSLVTGQTGSMEAKAETGSGGPIATRVAATPFVDTHEHLVEEEDRVARRTGGIIPCHDWAVLFWHYLGSDLIVAGMPQNDFDRFLSPEVDPADKWRLLEPHWPAVRNTGYAQVVRRAARVLYDIDDISGQTIPALSEAFNARIKPGYYKSLLCDTAGIESCQVNSLERTFMESRQPTLLMQDISILNFSLQGGEWRKTAERPGLELHDLADYHRVIDWWFDTYGAYAAAAKSQVAYSRRLDFEDVSAEEAAPLFKRLLDGDSLDEAARKKVDDHVFWYCVRKATAFGLPVKLHTGYYAGQNGMPLGRVMMNPADVCELLRRAPETTFVLMHIAYPYEEQMIAIAKHYSNAVIDMCWAWIINPAASARFLREFLVAAPANKLLTFGGDYIPVEPVVGHAIMARQGITEALNSLVDSGWLSLDDALALVEPVMCGNARRIFNTEAKARKLAQAPWLR